MLKYDVRTPQLDTLYLGRDERILIKSAGYNDKVNQKGHHMASKRSHALILSLLIGFGSIGVTHCNSEQSWFNTILPSKTVLIGALVAGYLAYHMKDFATDIFGPFCDITFNSYTEDVKILINGGVTTLIGECKDAHISDITRVVITQKDGTVIQKFTGSQLQDVRTINIYQDPETDEYPIEVIS